MALSLAVVDTLKLFERQYLQLSDPKDLAWPPTDVLRQLDAQTWLFKHLFDPNTVQYLPPARYQRRVIKKLFEFVESSVQNPDEDVGRCHFLLRFEHSHTLARRRNALLPQPII
jgi:hypothetical protein